MHRKTQQKDFLDYTLDKNDCLLFLRKIAKKNIRCFVRQNLI